MLRIKLLAILIMVSLLPSLAPADWTENINFYGAEKNS